MFKTPILTPNWKVTYHDNILPPPDNEAEWQQWGQWSPCSSSCGEGTRMRARPCSNPNEQCPGDSTEAESCMVSEECPGNCQVVQYVKCILPSISNKALESHWCSNLFSPGWFCPLAIRITYSYMPLLSYCALWWPIVPAINHISRQQEYTGKNGDHGLFATPLGPMAGRSGSVIAPMLPPLLPALATQLRQRRAHQGLTINKLATMQLIQV